MSPDPTLSPNASSPDAPTRLPEPSGSRVARRPTGDYRDELRSRRWDAAPLRNPEVEKTDPRIVVAAILLLCVITLVVIVVGYGSGFWSLAS